MFYINNMTQILCNFKEQSKIVRTGGIPLFGGGGLKRATQATPPPLCGAWVWRFHMWKRQIESPKRPNESPKWNARLGEGGSAERHFSNNLTMKQYFMMLISHKRSAKPAPFSLKCQSLPISFP